MTCDLWPEICVFYLSQTDGDEPGLKKQTSLKREYLKNNFDL